MKKEFYVFILLCVGLLTSCKVTKDLKENEYLVSKTSIKFKNPAGLKNKKKIKAKLNQVLKPQPNSGIFKLPLRIYQIGEKSKKKKGFKKWLQKNFGEAPAYYDEVTQSRNRLRMKGLLKDNGFFRSDIEVATLVKGKKIEMTYHVLTDGRYKVHQVFLPSDTTAIGRLIIRNQKKSLLREGKFYAEIALTNERTRLSEIASQEGYLEFNENNIYYFIDTLPGTFTTDIYMRVKPPIDAPTHRRYRIGKTIIHADYDLSNPDLVKKKDTIQIKPDLIILENNKLVEYKILDRMILQNAGDVISQKLQNVSVSHLLNLGIFKFVNLKYERITDSLPPIVNRNIYLTPAFNQKISGNLELNNRTGRFYGIAASGNYRHQNILKKAITFNASVLGGLETQIGNDLGFINTIQLNVEASLSAPRFILPFQVKPNSGLFIPQTTLKVGNDFQRRISQFSINSTNLKLGYQWKETSEKQHQIYPISINRVNVLDKTPEFENLISDNPRLENSFKNLFIGGLDYTYIFTNQSTDIKKDYWFFKGNIRTSGNLTQLAAKAFNFSKNADGKYEILSLPYAQFTSLEMDFRFYQKIKKHTLASRFSPAVGFSYGNSDVLPYIEQFFVGGANSLRAFRLRSVGPGGFVRATASGNGVENQFFDQTGDVKLEMSSEFRFGILGFFKGAFFVDAGNVWLLNNATQATQEFRFDTFWKQITVGAGIGLRLDLELIVLRVDIATPVRQSFLDEGFQWTFDRFDFGSSRWRGDNLIYNLAIGYPF
jgi:outer membrane protein insertion porin family